MFVVIEGMDASGKNTQSELLLERFKKEGNFKYTEKLSFPNYPSATGQVILSHLKNKWACMDFGTKSTAECDALVFQCIMTVDKIAGTPEYLFDQSFKTFLEYGVVSDRYWPSAYAYGKSDGVDVDWLIKIHKWIPKPDLYILIDIPPEESAKRRPERRDRYEMQAGLMEKIRDNYLELFNKNNFDGQPWHVIDGLGTSEEVHSRIMDLVSDVATQRVNKFTTTGV